MAVVELARNRGNNPDVPQWLEADYFQSIRELAELGLSELSRTDNAEEVRAILSIIAIAKGLRRHGEILIQYEEDELDGIVTMD